MVTKIDKININSTDYDIAVKGENVSGSVAAAATLDNLTATIDELNYSSGLTDNIQSQIDSANKNIDDLQNAIVETNSDIIKDTKDGGYKIVEIAGNTEQKRLSGKNLININAMVNSSLVNNNNGSYTLTRRTTDGESRFSAVQPFTILAGTTLHFSLKRHDNDTAIQLLFQNSSGTYPHSIYIGNWATEGSVTITDENITGICLCVLSEAVVGDNITFSEAQLEIGDKATEYEPYCGGVPSPNPAYPRPMLSTGDCVEIIQGTYNDNTGVYQASATRVCTKNKIPCNSGDIISIIAEKEVYFIFYFYNGETLVSTSRNVFSVTAPSNATHFTFRVGFVGEAEITPQTAGKITLTINGKYLVPIKTKPKNIATLKDMGSETREGITRSIRNGVIIASGTATGNNADMVVPFDPLIVLEGGVEYTISFPKLIGTPYEGVVVVHFYDDATQSYVFYTQFHMTESSTFIPPWTLSKCGHLLIRPFLGHSINASFHLQIEKGTIATEYAPPKETSAYILTNEPPRLGDIFYKENGLWKLEHNSIEEVYDGRAAWGLAEGNNYQSRRFYMPISNIPMDSLLLCSSFTVGKMSDVRVGVDFAIYSQDKYICINDINSYWATADDFNAYLAEKHMTILRKANEPTIETLDAESQIALNSLETFEGVTYVEFDTRIQPKSFKAKVGTTDEAALALENSLRHDSQDVQIKELTAAMLALSQL